MAFKDFVALYNLDKKVCQMIMDVEKINDSFASEAKEANLFNASNENEDKKKADSAELEKLRTGARQFIGQLFKFKAIVNEYQAYRNNDKLEQVESLFGLSKEQLKILEEGNGES